jgi:hypothetical protein
LPEPGVRFAHLQRHLAEQLGVLEYFQAIR